MAETEMNIDEAIAHAREVADDLKENKSGQIADEIYQIIEWLKELKERSTKK